MKNNNIKAIKDTVINNQKDHKSGKLASAILIIAVIANLIGVAAYQNSPVEKEYIAPPYVVEECIDMPPSYDEIVLEDDKEKQIKPRRISIWSIASLVVSWIIDTVANIFPHVLSAVLTPLGVKVLGWGVFAAGIVVSLVSALKKAFPNVPLKELLSKKRVSIVLLLTAVIILLCEIALFYFKKWMLVIKIAALILGLVLLISSFNKIKKHGNEKR